MNKEFTENEIDRLIGMAWEDRTTFDVIKAQFGISEPEVVKIMRRNVKASSFKMWQKRVHRRKTKHQALRNNEIDRFTSPNQRHQDRSF